MRIGAASGWFVGCRAWRTYADVAQIWDGRADPDWEADRDLIDQRLRDPWAPERAEVTRVR